MDQRKPISKKKKENGPKLEGKRFWRSKVFIKGVGTVEGEVKESDFKAFIASIPKGIEINVNKWCLSESEMKMKQQLTKEKNRLSKS